MSHTTAQPRAHVCLSIVLPSSICENRYLIDLNKTIHDLSPVQAVQLETIFLNFLHHLNDFQEDLVAPSTPSSEENHSEDPNCYEQNWNQNDPSSYVEPSAPPTDPTQQTQDPTQQTQDPTQVVTQAPSSPEQAQG
jgi:hypothetical protein